MLYLSSHSFHIWLFPFLGGVLVSTASIIIKIFSYSCLIFSFQLVDSSLHPLTSLQSTLYSHSSKLCNVNKELNISTISGLVLLSSHCLTSKLVLKHLHSILGKLFSAHCCTYHMDKLACWWWQTISHSLRVSLKKIIRFHSDNVWHKAVYLWKKKIPRECFPDMFRIN